MESDRATSADAKETASDPHPDSKVLTFPALDKFEAANSDYVRAVAGGKGFDWQSDLPGSTSLHE